MKKFGDKKKEEFKFMIFFLINFLAFKVKFVDNSKEIKFLLVIY